MLAEAPHPGRPGALPAALVGLRTRPGSRPAGVLHGDGVPDQAAAPAADDRAGSRRGDPVPCWVTADEADRDNGPLREFPQAKGHSLRAPAVARDHQADTPTGPRRPGTSWPRPRTWHRVNGGNGAKGRRWGHLALFATTRPEICLQVRRWSTRPAELAFYLCHTPQPASLAVLVKVAATRWCLEECFQAPKERGRTMTRSASTKPGTGTSPSSGSPWPGSPSPGELAERGRPEKQQAAT